MYFIAKLCLHTVINNLWPPEPCRIMLYLCPYH